VVTTACRTRSDDLTSRFRSSFGSVAFECFGDVATQIDVGPRQRWRVEAAVGQQGQTIDEEDAGLWRQLPKRASNLDECLGHLGQRSVAGITVVQVPQPAADDRRMGCERYAEVNSGT